MRRSLLEAVCDVFNCNLCLLHVHVMRLCFLFPHHACVLGTIFVFSDQRIVGCVLGGVCDVVVLPAASISSSIFLPVPYKVQRIIATDLNRLDVESLITLKCASVLCVGGGQTCIDFDIQMLCAVFPHDGGRAMTLETLESHLNTLVQVRTCCCVCRVRCLVVRPCLYSSLAFSLSLVLHGIRLSLLVAC
jgi:hypothetical protein